MKDQELGMKDLQDMKDQDRNPGSSSCSIINRWCDLRQTTSTFCQMGALGQSAPQALSSAVKIGPGGNPEDLRLRVPRHTEGLGGGSGTSVQPSCCH